MLKKKYYTAVQIHEAIDGVVDYSKHMEIYRRLAQMETEDVPEIKVGKWIPQPGGGCCCSECGAYALDRADVQFIILSVETKFCYNCGAKMDRWKQKSYADWELRRE